MPQVFGVDIGSVFSKAIILTDNQILSFAIIPTGGDYQKTAETVSIQAGRRGGEFLVATGVGAAKVPQAQLIMSDVSCHGKGVHYFFPEVRTIIELGGQSSKVIRVDERGKAIDFVISEKCAAGSGRFLQLMSKVLRIGFEDIGPLSMESKKAVEFSTGCAVFAESEAISRISEGACKEDILAGVHQAIAMKIINLLERIGSEGEIAITGGGAKDVGLIMTLEEKIGTKLLIPQDPLLTAALGAAIIAQERLLSS